MMARRGMLGLLAGGTAALVSGCGLFGGARYRFRMTVEVETQQGLRTGSSVYEVWAEKQSTFITGKDRAMRLKGEAVVIDRADGPLFALLRTAGANPDIDLAMASMAALDPAFHNDWVESAGRIAGSWSLLKGEIARKDWPMIVRFRDLADPKSVEQVDPAVAGVKRIMAETTAEPVTIGIEKRLGWLPSQRGSFVRRLSVSDPANTPIASILNKSDFSTEIGK